MIQNIQKNSQIRMGKTLDSLTTELAKIRTGRAHPSLLEHVQVDYYGSSVPISQAASVSIEDARTLAVRRAPVNACVAFVAHKPKPHKMTNKPSPVR